MEETWKCIQDARKSSVGYPYSLELFYDESLEYDLSLRAIVQDLSGKVLAINQFENIDLSMQYFDLSSPDFSVAEIFSNITIFNDLDSSSFYFRIKYQEKFDK